MPSHARMRLHRPSRVHESSYPAPSARNAALRSSDRLRQNSQTQFASRGVLCLVMLPTCPCRPPRCDKGASAAQLQLQCGAQEFSQTEAKLANSVCKPRHSVLESFGLRAPAALRSAPRRSFNAALRSSARLRQISQTQFASRGVLCSSHFALRALPHSAVRRGSSFNAALRSSARLRQNSQTQFASRGVLCSSHVAYATPPPSAVRQGS